MCGCTAVPPDDRSDAAVAELNRALGIPCVYSSEEQRVKMLPLDMDAAAGDRPEDFGALPGFRVRVIPVLGTMPAIFGQALAAYVLNTLAGNPLGMNPLEAELPTLAHITKLHTTFAQYERGTYGAHKTLLSIEDAMFLVTEAYHCRSPVSHERLGMRGVRMQLSRWRTDLESMPTNVVPVRVDHAEDLLRIGNAAVAEAAEAFEAAHAGKELSLDEERRIRHELIEVAHNRMVVEHFGVDGVEFLRSRQAWLRSRGYR
ncbi:hypothetical protein EON66_12450 [archaeon]|nr:MAG: hypothetical protein EON66_12450 [archaeon]